MSGESWTEQGRVLWIARVLGAGVALAPILFGLDVLGQGGDGSVGVGLGVHFALAAPLLLALILAWKRPGLGALLYALLGTFYAVSLLSRAGLLEAAVFAVPIFVIGALFWVAARPPQPAP